MSQNETEISNENIVPQNAAAQIKLAPFWTTNVIAWFAVVEAQFSSKGVKSERCKYELPGEIINSVTDTIINPPQTNPYSSLKQKLIDQFSDSDERRLEKLLGGDEIGDRKPSEYYILYLKTIAGKLQFSIPN